MLVGINVAVFIAMALSGISLSEPTIPQLLKWGANFGPLSLGPQPWRLLTSNYLHIGFLHILFNMWCLWDLGNLAERIFDGLDLCADLHRLRAGRQPGELMVASAGQLARVLRERSSAWRER